MSPLGIEVRLQRPAGQAAPMVLVPSGADTSTLDALLSDVRMTVVHVSGDRVRVRRADEAGEEDLGARQLVADGWELAIAADPEASLVDSDEWLGPELQIVSTGRRVRLPDVTGSVFAIGRHIDGDLVLQDKKVSRRHARIVHEDGSFFLEDLMSRSGTIVNDRPLQKERHRLVHGDLIRVGGARLLYQSPLEALSAHTRKDTDEPHPSEPKNRPAHKPSTARAPVPKAPQRVRPRWESAVLFSLVLLVGALFALAAMQFLA